MKIRFILIIATLISLVGCASAPQGDGYISRPGTQPSDQVNPQPADNNARCASLPGTSWKKLNWPGHPLHNKEACLPSDEQLNKDRCTGSPGTSWKKLNWPGHPLHNKEACLPSDDQIRQDKIRAGVKA